MVSWRALRHSREEEAAVACSSNHSKRFVSCPHFTKKTIWSLQDRSQRIYGEDVVPASAVTASGLDSSEHESLQRRVNVRVL